MSLMKLYYLHYLYSKYLNRMLIKWRVRNEIGTFVFIILNDHFFTGKKIRVQQYLLANLQFIETFKCGEKIWMVSC